MAASIALIPTGGRGSGVFFTYAIFADGRRVPSWESSDTTGAVADISFSANIWSTEVLGFRRWRCDVATGDRKQGPMPPNGMTQADVDALRREGCAHLIAANRGDQPRQFVIGGVSGEALRPEDIPALELMAQGGGFGCGSGLQGRIGEMMHVLHTWAFYASIGCWSVASILIGLHHHLRDRLRRRINLAGKSQCPLCEYLLVGASIARCSECGAEVAAEVQKCQLVLAAPAKDRADAPRRPLG